MAFANIIVAFLGGAYTPQNRNHLDSDYITGESRAAFNAIELFLQTFSDILYYSSIKRSLRTEEGYIYIPCTSAIIHCAVYTNSSRGNIFSAPNIQSRR